MKSLIRLKIYWNLAVTKKGSRLKFVGPDVLPELNATAYRVLQDCMKTTFLKIPYTKTYYSHGAFAFLGQLSWAIYAALETNPYFIQRRDCTGKLGLTGFQKAKAAARVLAYGCSSDAVNECVILGASTTEKSLRQVVKSVIENFAEGHL